MVKTVQHTLTVIWHAHEVRMYMRGENVGKVASWHGGGGHLYKDEKSSGVHAR